MLLVAEIIIRGILTLTPQHISIMHLTPGKMCGSCSFYHPPLGRMKNNRDH